MKKLISVLLTAALTACTFVGAASSARLPYALTAFADGETAILEKDVSLAYTKTAYDREEQKPRVFAEHNGYPLVEGRDFRAEYPDDCVNVGTKTIKVTGIGRYTGEVSADYEITPLFCGEGSDVTIRIGNCVYNGLPRVPQVTVKFGSRVIDPSDYYLRLENNVEVSENSYAVCTVKFRNNCYGEQKLEFEIKEDRARSTDVYIAAKAGQSVSFDLAPLKPAGAILGSPSFYSREFSPDDQPKVAFNVLRFTLSSEFSGTTHISIPITNLPKSKNFSLEFCITAADRTVPELLLRPIVKTYDGQPVTAALLNTNGSRATVDGGTVSGSWSFVEEPPVLICDKQCMNVMFTPDSADYAVAYGMVQVTISRKVIEGLQLAADTYTPKRGQSVMLTALGIPEDFDGSVSLVSADGNDRFSSRRTSSDNVWEYIVNFPSEDAYRTMRIKLEGSAFYAPCSADCVIKVGEPEQQDVPDNSPTSAEELSRLINAAENGAVIRVNSVTSIPEQDVAAARDKKLTIEIRRDSGALLVVQPAKLSAARALDLTVSGAVIPQVLLERAGGEQVTAFTLFAKSGGCATLKVPVEAEGYPLACLYLYSSTGELEHKQSVRVRDGIAAFTLPEPGKYVIMADKASHIYRDLNNDCVINISDVTTALELIVSMRGKPSDEQLAALDFNRDGMINIADVTDLLVFIVSK